MKACAQASARVLGALILCATSLLFGLSAVGKLASLTDFETVIHGHEVLPVESVQIVATMTPIIEFALGLLLGFSLLHPSLKPWAGLGAVSLMSAFTLYLAVVFSVQPDAASCGCGGAVIDTSVRAGLYRNGIVMSLLLVPLAAFRPVRASRVSGVANTVCT